MSESWFDSFPKCETCGEPVTGSHYHCSCGKGAPTGMYGHHSSLCKVATKAAGKLVHREFHHCGPDGDCELGGESDEATEE